MTAVYTYMIFLKNSSSIYQSPGEIGVRIMELEAWLSVSSVPVAEA